MKYVLFILNENNNCSLWNKNVTIIHVINALCLDAFKHNDRSNTPLILDIKREVLHCSQVGGACTSDKAELLTRRLLNKKCSTKKFISN